MAAVAKEHLNFKISESTELEAELDLEKAEQALERARSAYGEAKSECDDATNRLEQLEKRIPQLKKDIKNLEEKQRLEIKSLDADNGKFRTSENEKLKNISDWEAQNRQLKRGGSSEQDRNALTQRIQAHRTSLDRLRRENRERNEQFSAETSARAAAIAEKRDEIDALELEMVEHGVFVEAAKKDLETTKEVKESSGDEFRLKKNRLNKIKDARIRNAAKQRVYISLFLLLGLLFGGSSYWYVTGQEKQCARIELFKGRMEKFLSKPLEGGLVTENVTRVSYAKSDLHAIEQVVATVTGLEHSKGQSVLDRFFDLVGDCESRRLIYIAAVLVVPLGLGALFSFGVFPSMSGFSVQGITPAILSVIASLGGVTAVSNTSSPRTALSDSDIQKLEAAIADSEMLRSKIVAGLRENLDSNAISVRVDPEDATNKKFVGKLIEDDGWVESDYFKQQKEAVKKLVNASGTSVSKRVDGARKDLSDEISVLLTANDALCSMTQMVISHEAVAANQSIQLAEATCVEQKVRERGIFQKIGGVFEPKSTMQKIRNKCKTEIHGEAQALEYYSIVNGSRSRTELPVLEYQSFAGNNEHRAYIMRTLTKYCRASGGSFISAGYDSESD